MPSSAHISRSGNFGGFSATLFVLHLLALNGLQGPAHVWLAVLAGLLMTAALVALYVLTVKAVTSDEKLQKYS